ncbi:MAG: DUF2089 family protein [Anaerolineae bacterium]
MHTKIPACPNCGQPMLVTRLQCTNCETVIMARYAPCRFCRLSEASLAFLESFVKNRGNLKEMERELGQSYWSLRNELNEVIGELGYEVPAPEVAAAELAEQRRAILVQLNNGEINAQQAADLLGQLKSDNKPA